MPAPRLSVYADQRSRAAAPSHKTRGVKWVGDDSVARLKSAHRRATTVCDWTRMASGIQALRDQCPTVSGYLTSCLQRDCSWASTPIGSQQRSELDKLSCPSKACSGLTASRAEESYPKCQCLDTTSGSCPFSFTFPMEPGETRLVK